jgi:hypothetical protein
VAALVRKKHCAALTIDVTAPSPTEQFADVGGGRSQLVLNALIGGCMGLAAFPSRRISVRRSATDGRAAAALSLAKGKRSSDRRRIMDRSLSSIPGI